MPAVTPVRFQPHDAAYELDVEVMSAPELRRRVASNPQRGFERVDFPCVLFVRSGTHSHTIDFETHRLRAGSCVVVRPGQVHRFGPASDWDGWFLVIGAHHVPDGIDRLPSHIRIREEHAAAIVELFERLAADASSGADPALLDELLSLQAQLLVKRLLLSRTRRANPTGERLVNPAIASRYHEFRAAVDEHYRTWHLVTPYARHLGYSTKSVNRACQAMGGVTAKRVIVDRIILEARRLLAHSSEPVARISADLGFDEATNFVKFFRRETGLTPARFRKRLR